MPRLDGTPSTNGALTILTPQTEWRAVPIVADITTTITPHGILLQWQKDAYHVVGHFNNAETVQQVCTLLNHTENAVRMVNTLSHFLHTTKADAEAWRTAQRIIKRTQSCLLAPLRGRT